MTKPAVTIRKILRIGNSIGVTIDRSILDRVGIRPGNFVEIRSKGKGVLKIKKLSPRLPAGRANGPL